MKNIINHKTIKIIPLITAIIAGFGMGSSVYQLLLLPLFVIAWHLSPNYKIRFISALLFYMVAARDIVEGAQVFFYNPENPFSSQIMGLCFLLFSSFILALPWSFSSHKKSHKILILIGILFIVSIPPIGIIGWANPLTSAGLLFPNTSIYGLGLLLFLFAYFIIDVKKGTVIYLFLALFALYTWQPPKSQNEIIGIHTVYGNQSATKDIVRIQKVTHLIQENNFNGKILIFPETTISNFTNTTQRFMQSQFASINNQILFGAEIYDKKSHNYNNALINGNTGAVIYKQMQPVPISMWNPFKKGSTNANWSIQPELAYIGSKKAAILICYEHFLIFPVLTQLIQKPDIIIAPANGWWTKGTNILKMQENNIKAWASLYGIPYVLSFNRQKED